MDELTSKIITGIVVALLVFAMQSRKVHELMIGLFGGTAPPVIAHLLEDGKEEVSFWTSIDKCGSKECYRLYLQKYPQGQFIDIAKLQLGIKPKPVGEKIEHYIAYKNGTAFDTKHKLLWMRCSLGQQWTGSTCSGKAKTFTWDQAVKQSSTFAGYSDWRLPTIEELRTLVYCSHGKPDYFSMAKDAKDGLGCKGKPNKDYKSPTILQRLFPHTEKSLYWSSSPYAGGSDTAWIIHFNYGDDYLNSEFYEEYVRLVRSGQ